MFECKKCGSTNYRLEQKGTATGLYCADCGFWHQWLGKEDLKRYQAGLKESELSAAEFEALKAENENLKKELSLAKSFHDLACKERDLERYRVDKLSAVNAELKARLEKAVELPIPVGTTVYVLEKKIGSPRFDFVRKRFINSYGLATEGYKNVQLMVPEGDYDYPVSDIFYTLDKIDKVVFLTLVEAEAHLKELEEKK